MLISVTLDYFPSCGSFIPEGDSCTSQTGTKGYWLFALVGCVPYPPPGGGKTGTLAPLCWPGPGYFCQGQDPHARQRLFSHRQASVSDSSSAFRIKGPLLTECLTQDFQLLEAGVTRYFKDCPTKGLDILQSPYSLEGSPSKMEIHWDCLLVWGKTPRAKEGFLIAEGEGCHF